MLRRFLTSACLGSALLLSGCTRGGDGAVDVVVIGEPSDLTTTGIRLPPAAALIAGATAQGLVRIDEAGQIVPGIAERWIVTEDGLSYIFRIRESEPPGGEKLTARTVQQALSSAVRSLARTSLGRDLSQIRDIRAMTGRVIEIRLTSPMPGFLQLLAQPELGVRIGAATSGPMRATERDGSLILDVLPPEARGYPSQPEWAESVRQVRVTAMDAAGATQAFSDGRFQLLLGGTIGDLPRVSVGPLSRGTIRLDSVIGLFGLDVARPQGFLASAANREALALALDRPALLKPFNIAGWIPTTRLVAPGLPDDPGIVGERWAPLSPEQRRAIAAARIARWRASNGGALALTVFLPKGPGYDILFGTLAGQLAEIGLTLKRAASADSADLVLRDRAARYAGPRWFLDQFACSIAPRQCLPEVDSLVESAAQIPDAVQQERLLAQAEDTLTAANLYIPLGAPIRFSLVRSRVQGFSENAWGVHPLFPLSGAPI